jgi:nicotinamidase-related amidase
MSSDPARFAGRRALVVVDVQRGFDDAAYWGPRDNPDCEANVERLIAAARSRGDAVVFVRHDSEDPDSPLHPGRPGNAFKACVTGEPDLLVVKSVNASFLGRPALGPWLDAHGIRGIDVCGITTNHCCETTARLGGNLGYDVRFVLDATHTFDRGGVPASELRRVTGVNLDGEFARVVATDEAVASA